MDRSNRLWALALACVTALLLSPAAPASHTRPRPRGAMAPRAERRSVPPRPMATPEVDAAFSPPPSPPSPPPPAYPAQFRVGAVFSGGARAGHHCTGSVVDSPHGDLVVTAAHCVPDGTGGAGSGLVFAPGLRAGGETPAGRWRVREAVVAPSWAAGTDPSVDVAFLVVEPLSGRRIQDVVGGNPIAFDHPDGGPVQLIGYPSDNDMPVICDGDAQRSGLDQLRVYCPGFSGGTSGSPWLSGAEGGVTGAGSGSVIGVIGGYERGGSTAEVSYSSYFDSRVRALYEQAVARS